jgi:hypothetical protein
MSRVFELNPQEVCGIYQMFFVAGLFIELNSLFCARHSICQFRIRVTAPSVFVMAYNNAVLAKYVKLKWIITFEYLIARIHQITASTGQAL